MSTINEKLKLIREGVNVNSVDLDLGVDSLFESTLELYLQESDNADLMLEASLNIFDHIGMLLFDKFSKVEKIADENLDFYNNLTAKMHKYGKPVKYRLNSDLAGVIAIKDAMVKTYNEESISAGKVFNILSSSGITREKFDVDERTLFAAMDGDLHYFKTLLKKFKQYSAISHLTYAITDTKKYDPEDIIKGRKKFITDILQRRDEFRSRIKMYSEKITSLDNSEITSYKPRLTALVKQALQYQIYYLTGVLRVLTFLFNEDKKILNQISEQVDF